MWFFDRKGPSGFSASSTAEEVTQGIDGTGLTAIVTGHISHHLSLYTFVVVSSYTGLNRDWVLFKKKKKIETGFNVIFTFQYPFYGFQ